MSFKSASKTNEQYVVEEDSYYSKYITGKCLRETGCSVIGITLLVINIVFLVFHFDPKNTMMVPICVILGILSADFIGGLIHWTADTWGSINMPIFGKNLIRPTREHHIDPNSITRHDFIGSNGDFLALATPFLCYLAFQFLTLTQQEIDDSYNVKIYFFMMVLFTSFTNQCHKWAHTSVGLPWYIEKLQDSHLILPRRHHRIHHVSPRDTYYCITTGWLNYPLDVIGFWSTLEVIIHQLTGYKPRNDDMKWAIKSK